MAIDYTRTKAKGRALKSQLTRARNSKDPVKVVKACQAALAEWDRPDSATYDTWPMWQLALREVFPWPNSPELWDLRDVTDVQAFVNERKGY